MYPINHALQAALRGTFCIHLFPLHALPLIVRGGKARATHQPREKEKEKKRPREGANKLDKRNCRPFLLFLSIYLGFLLRGMGFAQVYSARPESPRIRPTNAFLRGGEKGPISSFPEILFPLIPLASLSLPRAPSRRRHLVCEQECQGFLPPPPPEAKARKLSAGIHLPPFSKLSPSSLFALWVSPRECQGKLLGV